MTIEEKKQKVYQCKNSSIDIEDIDEGTRKVKGYFSTFDVKDSDSDIILKGAFAKSISERGVDGSSYRKIAHLRNHDWNMAIGKLLELREDEKGLLFVSQLGRSTKGEDALLDYQDGIIREHSIGFQYIWDKVEYEEKEDTFFVKEVNLFEGSSVTFGANELTPVLEVSKSEDIESNLAAINDQMAGLIKALKNGKGTDERLYNIELGLKATQQKYNSLIRTLEKPSVKDTFKHSEESDEDKKKVLLLNLIRNV